LNESAPYLFRLLTSARMSNLLATINYDWSFTRSLPFRRNFLRCLDIDFTECVDAPAQLDTARKVFERKIRYWAKRPMDNDPSAIVSPADARVLVGNFFCDSQLYLKGKFFDLKELLGLNRPQWFSVFAEGEYAIFRLTPDKYHYNHVPVDGVVVDYYEIQGDCHACNPNAVVAMVTPHSKNSRIVTVIDTDVPGGSGIGRVAMIEVVALMIGTISQCYSASRYDDPVQITCGMALNKGQPKSLYHPGSSTDVLLFEKGRINFCADLVRNMNDARAVSRFTAGFGKRMVETEVKVRSTIAHARSGKPNNSSCRRSSHG